MEKRKKVKPGKVIRLTPDLVKIVMGAQKKNETIPSVIRRLIGSSEQTAYVLPSDIHKTIEDARGVAIQKAVRTKQKSREKPIEVRVKE